MGKRASWRRLQQAVKHRHQIHSKIGVDVYSTFDDSEASDFPGASESSCGRRWTYDRNIAKASWEWAPVVPRVTCERIFTAVVDDAGRRTRWPASACGVVR